MADEGPAADGQETVEGGSKQEKEPEKVYTEEQFTELFSDRFKREQKRLEKKLRGDLRAELLADEAFRNEALQEWKVKPGKAEGGELTDEKVQELHKAWARKSVDPLKTENETLRVQVESLRKAGLERDLLADATGLVQRGLLKRQSNGSAPIVDMLRGNFVWDDDGEAWRVTDGKDGYRPSPSGDQLYMTPSEFLAQVWAQDPANAWAVLDQTQAGSDSKGAGNRDLQGKRIYSEADYLRTLENGSDEELADALTAMKEGRVRKDAA